jgi:hypothetical protein
MGELKLHSEKGKICLSNEDLYYWFEDDGRERHLFLEDFKNEISREGCFTFLEGDSYTITAYNKRNHVTGCSKHGEVFVDEETRGFRKRAKSLANARGRVLAHHYDHLISEMNGGPVSYGDGYMTFFDWLLCEYTTNGVIGTLAFDDKGILFGVLLPFADELWQIYRIRLMAMYNLRGLPYP